MSGSSGTLVVGGGCAEPRGRVVCILVGTAQTLALGDSHYVASRLVTFQWLYLGVNANSSLQLGRFV